MKKMVILGSTGSIGTQTLEVVDFLNEEWEIVGLTANNNIDLLEKQARHYLPSYLVIMNETLVKELEYRLADIKIEILSGIKGLEYLAGLPDLDIVINSLVGAVGLRPTIAALKTGHRIGLANKESLVIGGRIINQLLKKSKGSILPLDSEHNAIFQLLEGKKTNTVEKIILTASGGPFREFSLEALKSVNVKQALNHPNWDMGGKITIDSATLMNKGLEVIEAHWLFEMPYEKIEVVVHPESIIHSFVEFIDRSLLAELGVADMKIPIQYVLTYPEKKLGQSKRLNLLDIGSLNFQSPDMKKFPALNLAYHAGKEGGTMPTVLNAANEVAVAFFLKEKIKFVDISMVIESVLEQHQNITEPEINDIYEIDNWARIIAEEVIVGCC